VAYWLKLGYFTAAQEGEPSYWLGRTWVSDGPGRVSPRWKKRPMPVTGDPRPPYGPQYEVGDRLVVYVTGHGVCPAILEVIAEPRWNPDWVEANGTPGDDDKWGVVTEVKGLWSLAIDAAPKLEEIGVESASVQRKGHIWLEEKQYREAERLIASKDAPAPPPPAGPAVATQVPIEARVAAGYEIAPAVEVKQASRREALLVGDFQAHLEAKGEEVSRYRLRPPESAPIYCDLFNHTRKQLIEAKAGASRHEIRMAIGQLADYGRFIEGLEGRAVLLGAKPHLDLRDLLDKQDIAAIWRSGSGFADNADGLFV
jgi:hypothetical protein